MKKNAIGHMTAPKESVGRRIRRWDILPRLLCLLIAIVLWLVIVNVKNSRNDEVEVDIPLTQTVAPTET